MDADFRGLQILSHYKDVLNIYNEIYSLALQSDNYTIANNTVFLGSDLFHKVSLASDMWLCLQNGNTVAAGGVWPEYRTSWYSFQ